MRDCLAWDDQKREGMKKRCSRVCLAANMVCLVLATGVVTGIVKAVFFLDLGNSGIIILLICAFTCIGIGFFRRLYLLFREE